MRYQSSSRSGASGTSSAARASWALRACALLAACASEPPVNAPVPCARLGGACDMECLVDAQCGAGLYCRGGRCGADCAAGVQSCAGGRVCAANGRCVDPSMVDSGVRAPTDGGRVAGDACASVTVQLARRQASVMLLIDQSGSMTQRFGSTTRWEAIRHTLVDPTEGVLRPLQDELQLGLAMYTSHNGTRGGACPQLAPPLATSLRNYDAIARALNAATPQDDTPTAESVTAAVQLLNRVGPDDAVGVRALVLATDGEPDTCADPDAQGDATRQQAARALSVAAVRQAFTSGVRTYVISVGSELSEAHLQDLANAGAGATGARFYRALDPAALTTAFRAITTGLRSCVFRLNGRVDAAAAGSGDVRLDATPVTFGDANGWRLRSPTEIELVGAACTRAQTTGSVLSAQFPCNVVTPG